MAKDKVTLGGPARNAPTAGFVRRSEGSVKKKNPGQEPGGGSPSIEGGTTTPAPTAAAESPDGILDSWRKLPARDRKELLARMSLELQRASPGDIRDVDLWAEAVQEALVAALGPSGGASHGPQVVRRIVGAPVAWAPVAEFLDQCKADQFRPPERYAFMRLLARLLVDRARRVSSRADIPLTPKLVASNAQHLTGIFDNAFPSYLAAGLAGTVARLLLAGGDNVPRHAAIAAARDEEATRGRD